MFLNRRAVEDREAVTKVKNWLIFAFGKDSGFARKGQAMRSNSRLLRALPLAAGLFAAAAPAVAGGQYGEQYHADSFGNLIVYSPAGYKRIIVGQGHVLAEYEAQAAAESQGYDDDGPVVEGHAYRHCYTVPGMFKGRSYMYGLPDGVVPTPARRICD